MKTIVISFIFISLLVFNPGNVFAQRGPNAAVLNPESKGLIIGKVLDKSSNAPMEYSSIAVYSLPDSSLVTGTVTNTSGEFELEDIPYGKYFIEVKFIGYEKSVISPVEITRDTREANLGMLFLSLSTEALEEVEIVADQRRVEYRIDKKVVNVSEDLSAAGGTAVDVLENTPSVTVDIEGNVSLRGSSNFTVLINGKPTVLDAADALRQIPASSIQNIEIITNPSVKFDPDGNGGIINVVMKKQLESGTTGIMNASVGLNNKYRIDALVNRRVGKLNYFVGGGYDNNLYAGTLIRDHITYLDNGTENHNNAEGAFDFIRGGSQIKAGMDYDITPRSNIAFEANGGTSKFGIDRSNNAHEFTIPGTDDIYYVNSDLLARDEMYYSANLNYSQTFDTSAHKLVIMANFSNENGGSLETLEYHQADSDYNVLPSESPTKTRNVEDGNEFEYRLQIDYSKPLGNGMLEAGYQARLDDNYTDFVFQEYDPDTDNWNSLDENSSEITFFRNIQSGYVQYGGSLRKLQFQAGLRGEYTNRLIEYANFNSSYQVRRFDLFPTLHLAREFKNDNQLMLSYSKRVNRPRGYFLDSIPSYIDKTTVRIGNPGLQPEYVNSFELGYQKGWGKNFLAIESYYRNTTNLITRVTEFDEASGIFYQRVENINEDHVLGGEVMVNWQFAKWFNLNASTDIYYYRITGELFGEEFNNSNVSWKANTNATFTITPMSRIQANLGYMGPTVTAQGSAEGMYYMNLAVRQDLFKRKLSATLQVRDLFGSMKREFTASGDGFSQYVLMQREPRVVMLTLSYKINNYKVNQRDQQPQGGMEMDSGF